jgi:hypothetical protein
VAVSGHYAVVAETGFLEMVNISNPAAPVQAGTCILSGSPQGVIARGDYAFVAGFGSGLEVVDISDPAHPVLVGVGLTQSTAISVALQGPYVFVGEMGAPSTFEIFDASSPSQPVHIGSVSIAGQVNDVTVTGTTAYLAVGNAVGLQIVDVSNPRFPVALGQSNTPDGVRVSVVGDYVLLSDSTTALKVMNVSDATTIISVGQLSLSDPAVSTVTSGTVASVADYNGGFRTLSLW